MDKENTLGMDTVDGWIDLPLDHLPLRSTEYLSGFNLIRVPTWDELFRAVHQVVENYKEKHFVFGNGAALAIPSSNADHGRCALYAGVTWAFLANFFKMPCGIGVGGVKIKCSDSSGNLLFPEHPDKIDPISGNYHAWTGFEYNNETFFVDMSYFNFKKNYKIVGPKKYISANMKRLDGAGIIYKEDADATKAMGISSNLRAFLPLIDTLCHNLRMT